MLIFYFGHHHDISDVIILKVKVVHDIMHLLMWIPHADPRNSDTEKVKVCLSEYPSCQLLLYLIPCQYIYISTIF